MSDISSSAANQDSAPHLDFTPANRRYRHDGWTPEKQHDFIQALAESGCVAEACGVVGMSPRSAYTLRAMPSANMFRQAWDIALDYAIRRLGDAALSRALHGVSRPVFYKGEQVGERRYYDERLTQFLLRYRDPVRYGRWNDSHEARRHPDGAGITLARALNAVVDAAHGADPDEFSAVAPDAPAGGAPDQSPIRPDARARVVGEADDERGDEATSDDALTPLVPPCYLPPDNPLAFGPPRPDLLGIILAELKKKREAGARFNAMWDDPPDGLRPGEPDARSNPTARRSIRARRRQRGRRGPCGDDVP